jgi:hypothetical protein
MRFSVRWLVPGAALLALVASGSAAHGGEDTSDAPATDEELAEELQAELDDFLGYS